MSTNPNSQPTEMFLSTKDLPKVNWKNIVIEKPVTNSFTKKGTTTTIEWTTSDVHFKGSNDQKLSIFFELPPQIVWGINGTWPLGTETENQTLENIEGYQICYPLTTLATMKNPTPDESAAEKFFDSAWNKAIGAMGEFTESDLLDGPAGSAYTTAEKKKNMAYAMKPVYEYPSIKDEKSGKRNIDMTKPKRIYIKLVTKAKGTKMQCLTKIYGPCDKLVSPIKYMSSPGNAVQGVCHPVVHWEGIFWGAHGKNTYGGSLKFRVVEMNFTPKSSTGLSHRRMLSPNVDVEEVNENESSDDGDFAFKHPSGSGIVTSDFALEENANPMTTFGEGSDTGSGEGLSQDEKEEDTTKVANDSARAKKKALLIAKKKQQLLEKRKANK